jgi:hypothetical protein
VAVLQEKLQEKAGEALNLYNQLFALRKMMPIELAAGQDAAAGTPPPSSPLPMQGELAPVLLAVALLPAADGTPMPVFPPPTSLQAPAFLCPLHTALQNASQPDLRRWAAC